MLRRVLSVLLSVALFCALFSGTMAEEKKEIVGEQQVPEMLSWDEYQKLGELERAEDQYIDKFIIKYSDSGAKASGNKLENAAQKIFDNSKAKKQEKRDAVGTSDSVKDQFSKKDLSKKGIAQKGKSDVSIKEWRKGYKVIELAEDVEPQEYMDQMKSEMGESLEYIQPDYQVELSASDVVTLNLDLGGEESATPAPQTTEVPEATQAPDVTQVPETTQAPEATQAPTSTPQAQSVQPINTEVLPYSVDADMQAAWTLSTGVGTTVAIIDTGIDVTHPDLSGRVVAGYDFVNDTTTVYNPDLGMDQAHGTHVAGIIAKTAPGALIMPLKCFENGRAYTSDLINAIEYAEQNGATIVNCSWGGSDNNQALKEAIQSSGMLFVCAAGNNRANIDEAPIYPAAFALDNIISVSSLNDDLGYSYFSNYGINNVDIAMLGRNVNSTFPGGEYGDMSGTSMAAGFVSGGAALVSALGETDVKARLKNTAYRLSNLQSKVNDGDKLGLYNAVSNTSVSNIMQVSAAADFDVLDYQRTPEENWELFNSLQNLQVAAGRYVSLALKSNGTVWAWGSNVNGQIGDGSYIDDSAPKEVVGLTNITAIAVGTSHCLAIDSAGIAWAWGNNGSGKLGDGTTITRTIPVQVSGLTGTTAIDAGDAHSIALKSDGTVYTWGSNSQKALGESGISSRYTPGQLTDLSDVTEISSGPYNNMVLISDGTVYAWGTSYFGELGVGTNSIPTQIESLAGVTAISLASYHSLVLKNDGTVWVSGYNGYGQLGTGTTTNRNTFGKINSLSNVEAIYTGYYMSMVKKLDGTVWAFGLNDNGQLCDGTTVMRKTPTATIGLANVNTISLGTDHGLALMSDGLVLSWGMNNSGQLGDGRALVTNSPIPLANLSGASQISCGDTHAVALKNDGTVWWWGFNRALLGAGTAATGVIPEQVSGLLGITSVSAGSHFSLALKGDGTVWSWGRNDAGQLGDNTSANSYVPVQVLNLTGITGISAGYTHSLALKNDGTVWAWGTNSYGQLGDGTTVMKGAPVQVSDLTGITAVFVGQYHSLALKDDGTVWAWGSNGSGQLGDNTTTNRNTPVQVSGLTGITEISAGNSHSLALKNDGTVWSWGNNGNGQLGDNSITTRKIPVQVTGLTGITAIAAGQYHSLARKNDGTAWSWGKNVNGELGDGSSNTYKAVPTQISVASNVSGVTAGYVQTFVETATGFYGTGDNRYSQLLNGHMVEKATPYTVEGPINGNTSLSTLTITYDGVAQDIPVVQGQTSYDVTVPAASLPTIDATLADYAAQKTIVQATDVPGSGTITVVNGSITTVYTINFSLEDQIIIRLNTPNNLSQTCLNMQEVLFTATVEPADCVQSNDIEWYINDVKQAVTGMNFSYTPTEMGNYNIQAKIAGNENALLDSKTISVAKANPVVTWPLPILTYTEGVKLSDIALDQGFAWVMPDTLLYAPGGSYSITYTPGDEEHYNVLTREIDVIVNDTIQYFTINSGAGLPGDTVSLVVQMNDVKNLTGISGIIDYDKDTLELRDGTGYTKPDSGFVDIYNCSVDNESGYVYFFAGKFQAYPMDSVETPTIITLHFTIKSTATNGNHKITIKNANTISANYSIESISTPTIGVITVAGGLPEKINPIVTWPEVSSITFGQTFGDAISGGNANIAGVFAIQDAEKTPLESNAQYSKVITFEPVDTNNYNMTTQDAIVVVNKADPVVTWPTIEAVSYVEGLKLSDMPLSEGLTWANPNTVLNVPGGDFEVIYMPTDTTNYNTLTKEVSIIVNKVSPVIVWPTLEVVDYFEGIKLSDISLGQGFVWDDPETTLSIPGGNYSATYSSVSDNYYTLQNNITVVIDKANPLVTWPTLEAVDYTPNLKLSDITLPEGFAWDNPTKVLCAPGGSYTVTYTPTDPTRYKTVKQNVSVVVNKASPSYIIPVLEDITYSPIGKLSDITLPTGWSWDTGTTIPTVGVSSYPATFIPSDTINYKIISENISLSVQKADPAPFWPKPVVKYVEGLTLSDISLGEGFEWETPNTLVALQDGSYSVIYTPTDISNYNTLTKDVVVVVKEFDQYFTIASGEGEPGDTVSVVVRMNNVKKLAGIQGTINYDKNSFELNGSTGYTKPDTGFINFFNCSISNQDGYVNFVGLANGAYQANSTETPTIITFNFTIKSTATNGDHHIIITDGKATLYNSYTEALCAIEDGVISVTGGLNIPTVTWPTVTPITYGQTFSDAISSGVGAGTFSIEDADIVPDASDIPYQKVVTFTPADTITYSILTQVVEVTVNGTMQNQFVMLLNDTQEIQNGLYIAGDDITNTIVGLDLSTMEYAVSTDKGATYGAYTSNLPMPTDFCGSKMVMVRLKAQGENPAGESMIVIFTPNIGDVNGDGIIDISDVIIAAQIVVDTTIPYTPEQILRANVSDKYNLEVDISDVILIAERCVGISTPFPAENDQESHDLNITWPIISDITYGQTFSEAISCDFGISGDLVGTFTIEDADVFPDVNTYTKIITFTPSDTDKYNTLTKSELITVNKATPTVVWPTLTSVTYAENLKLSSIPLDNGFSWVEPTTTINAPGGSYVMTFTPNDAVNYKVLTQDVLVVVNKAEPTVTWPSAITVDYMSTLTLSNISLPTGFAWVTPDLELYVPGGSYSAIYTPKDSINYIQLIQYVEVEVLTVVPEIDCNVAATESTLGISWSTVNKVTSYDIMIDDVILISNVAARKYTIDELSAGTRHKFKVRARKGELVCDWSREATAVTMLPTPTGLAATTGDNSITLSWDPVEGATSYSVLVNDQEQFSTNQTRFTYSNTEIDQAYNFSVKATNEQNISNSYWSKRINSIVFGWNINALQAVKAEASSVYDDYNLAQYIPYSKLDRSHFADCVLLYTIFSRWDSAFSCNYSNEDFGKEDAYYQCVWTCNLIRMMYVFYTNEVNPPEVYYSGMNFDKFSQMVRRITNSYVINLPNNFSIVQDIDFYNNQKSIEIAKSIKDSYPLIYTKGSSDYWIDNATSMIYNQIEVGNLAIFNFEDSLELNGEQYKEIKSYINIIRPDCSVIVDTNDRIIVNDSVISINNSRKIGQGMYAPSFDIDQAINPNIVPLGFAYLDDLLGEAKATRCGNAIIVPKYDRYGILVDSWSTCSLKIRKINNRDVVNIHDFATSLKLDSQTNQYNSNINDSVNSEMYTMNTATQTIVVMGFNSDDDNSQDAKVTNLQNALINAGCWTEPNIEPSGYFGNVTQDSIIRFSLRVGYKEDDLYYSDGTYIGYKDYYGRDIAEKLSKYFNISSGGTYKLISKGCVKVLDIYNPSLGLLTSGANAEIWDYNGGSNQQWVLQSVRSGYYTLNSINNDDLSLDVDCGPYGNMGNNNDRQVMVWKANSKDPAQLWKIVSTGRGYYKLVSQVSGDKVLDIAHGYSYNGANVVQYEYKGGDNQQWDIHNIYDSGIGPAVAEPPDDSSPVIDDDRGEYGGVPSYKNDADYNFESDFTAPANLRAIHGVYNDNDFADGLYYILPNSIILHIDNWISDNQSLASSNSNLYNSEYADVVLNFYDTYKNHQEIFDGMEAALQSQNPLIVLAAGILYCGGINSNSSYGKLKYAGKNDIGHKLWRSTQGLEYGFDKIYGNRVNHVLSHGEPNLNKEYHTVFNISKKQILGLVDEAWSMKRQPQVNDPKAYVVNMGRVIGTNGETKVKIVVSEPGSNNILTAYPIM